MVPIILTAFGTTADALATYAAIDKVIRRHSPDEEIIWAYSSQVVTRSLQGRGNVAALHIEEALGQLAARGAAQVVVQSLHLFPGSEFHRLHGIARKSSLQVAIGKPLFTEPEDYHALGRILQPILGQRPDEAILLLGHGTSHPVWTAYYTMEKILRRRFGDRLFVGVVEKAPDSSHLIDEIAGCGYTEVFVVPLFLVNGMHYRRDIVGESQESWLARLRRRSITATCLQHGLGLLPGIGELIVAHIASARRNLLANP